MQCILETKERGVVIVTLQLENGTVDFAPAYIYIYLEVHLNEHIDVCIIADSLSKAEERALGPVITIKNQIKMLDSKHIVNFIIHVLYRYKITVLGFGGSNVLIKLIVGR